MPWNTSSSKTPADLGQNVATVRSIVATLRRHSQVAFFVGGFLLDALTLDRIDSLVNLAIQCGYIAGVTLLIVLQDRVDRRLWVPAGWINRLWHYSTEALHFFYGGLLSAYVVLYSKSASAGRSLAFLLLVAALMIANEMPQVKRAGHRLRIGLYAFCLVSFLNYLIPIAVGRMGWWTFALAILAAAGATAGLVRFLSRGMPDPSAARRRLFAPAIGVLAALVGLYAFRWIPPVPLSLKTIGVYHRVERLDGKYRLIYPKPPFYRFWRKESRPFEARPNDVVYVFTRIFAPRRFSHRIVLEWSWRDPVRGRWQVTDRVPLPISGGRGEGYRGFGTKANYQPGDWRVDVQTEDGRSIGHLSFRIDTDTGADPRRFLTTVN